MDANGKIGGDETTSSHNPDTGSDPGVNLLGFALADRQVFDRAIQTGRKADQAAVAKDHAERLGAFVRRDTWDARKDDWPAAAPAVLSDLEPSELC
jgi:hypothetical protein